MPKLNLHLDTKQGLENFHEDLDLEGIKWNDSLLAKQPKFYKVAQKNALKLVLLNVAKYGTRKLLYYRRNQKMVSEMHNPHQISWKSITGVVDALKANGMVEHTLGDVYYSTDPDDRHTSSFVASQELVDIAKSLIVEEEVTEKIRSHIIFLDSYSNHIEYEPTPYTERIEQIMSEISAYTNAQDISLDAESLLPIYYMRQYRDYDFQKEFRFGGRSYPTHTSIRKTDRPRIMINGEPTVSHDYSSSVPSIVYQRMTGTRRDQVEELVAPYEVQGMTRKVAKRIVNIMLNSTRSNVHKGISGHFNHAKTDLEEKQGFKEAKEHFGEGYLDKMIEAVAEKNKPISQAFLQGSAWGQHWSWIEANIVYETAHYLMMTLDMPLLIVHDEFIVPQSHSMYVGDYMYTVGLGDEYKTDYTDYIRLQEPQV